MKIKKGDVFTISLDKSKMCFGQVVDIIDEAVLICIYDLVVDKKGIIPSLKVLESKDIALLGYTLDAKFYHKHWKVIGNKTDNLNTVYLPYYKIGTPPIDIYIVNHRGERVKEANVKEFEELEYQEVLSPAMFEDVIKGYFNLMEWDNDNYGLLYSYVLNSVKIANNNPLKSV